MQGKVAIVTGAGQGLGEHVARLLAARGAAVMVTDIDGGRAAAIAADLAVSGADVVSARHDVGDEASWAGIVELCRQRFGKAHILVNNAGLIEIEPLAGLAVEAFDRIMRVNVRGPFLGCKAALALMADGGGAIVNVASMAGMIANMPGACAYSTSKGAVRMLTKAAAIDLVHLGIRVNAVLPGTIATPATQPYLDDPGLRPIVLGRTPMGRPANPLEIARAVAFVASDEASYMTGAELVIDGGWTAC